jgi:hypothetical protein
MHDYDAHRAISGQIVIKVEGVAWQEAGKSGSLHLCTDDNLGWQLSAQIIVEVSYKAWTATIYNWHYH